MKLEASIVLPANDPEQVREQTEHLGHYFEGFQYIPIYGASSFFDAWTKGMEQADFDTLILTHQDVLLCSVPHDLSEQVKTAGLLGAAGSKEITIPEPWWFSTTRLREGKLSGAAGHISHGKCSVASYGPFGDVAVLDGVFLATAKEKLKQIPLPDLGACYWDFYDHVVSLEFLRQKLPVRTIPIHLFHKSTGANRRPSFFSDAEVFRANYFRRPGRSIGDVYTSLIVP